MRLRLELKNPAPLPGAQTLRALERGSMIIGRSQQADWVLPDPERIISKAHCRIERGTQGFILVDMSVNGVMLNGLPINRGIPKQLENGMVLQIGTALIDVRIDADPAPMPTAAAPIIPAAFVPGASPAPETKPAPQIAVSAPTIAAAAPVSAPIPADFLDGPFGTAAGDKPAAATTTPSSQAAGEAPGSGPTALQDWWDPIAKSADVAEPTADIASAAGSSGLGQTDIAVPLAPAPPAMDLAGLVRSKAGLNASTLAGMVASAAEILPPEERQRLLKRLHELIGEASG